MTDGYGNYGNNERCEVEALRGLTLVATQYDNEDTYDYVTVNGVQYRTTFPLQGVSMSNGARFVWTSDVSVTRAGYTLCAAGGALMIGLAVYIALHGTMCIDTWVQPVTCPHLRNLAHSAPACLMQPGLFQIWVLPVMQMISLTADIALHGFE